MTNQRSNDPVQQGLVITNPSFTNLTNPIARGVGNYPPPPLGGGVVTNPDGGTRVGHDQPLPTLDELSEIKERIDAGVTYCRKHRHNDRLHGKGYTRLTRILARDYLPALEQLNGLYERQELIQERDAIITRLETGWQLADSESRARTFAKLLARYETLTDAIDGDVLARHLGRAE